MIKQAIKSKILRKLIALRKWGASHTEEKNLFKSLPGHLRGTKIVHQALDELYYSELLIRSKKTNEWHVSLNPRKKEEIMKLLDI